MITYVVYPPNWLQFQELCEAAAEDEATSLVTSAFESFSCIVHKVKNCTVRGKHVWPNKRLVQKELREKDRETVVIVYLQKRCRILSFTASEEHRNQDVNADRKQRQHVHMFGIRTPRKRQRERRGGIKGLSTERKGVVPPTGGCGLIKKTPNRGKKYDISLPPFRLCRQLTGGSGSPRHPGDRRSLWTLDMLFLRG